MINIQDAHTKLTTAINETYQLKHAEQSAKIMSALAKKLNQDTLTWELTGLLHDFDYAQTANKPSEHGLISAQLLANDLPIEALNAIKAHNYEMNGSNQPIAQIDFALRAAETLAGLLNASSLMRPTGFEGMQVSSIKKKFKDKAFAANVNRENIKECSNLGLELDEFMQIAIDALGA